MEGGRLGVARAVEGGGEGRGGARASEGGERKRWQGGRKPIGERKKTIFFIIIIYH